MLANNARKNILINFRGGIGDFVLFTPVLRNITRDSRYNLFFLGNKTIQQLVEKYDYFEKSFFVDHSEAIFNKIITLTKLFFKIRNLKIYICITPICSFGKFSYLVTKLSKAKIRIGFEHEKNIEIYTHIIKIIDKERDIEQNLKILDILDIECVTKDTELTIPKHSFKIAKNYFLKQRIDLNRKTIAIAPLVKGMSLYPSKEWPLNKYTELIEKIIDSFQVNIILMGSKDELNRLKLIKEFMSSERIFFQNVAFLIYEAAALLKKCSLLICNDGGLMHIAAAINIPIVSIWGPTSPTRWGYFEKNNFFAVKKNNCIPCREYKKKPVKCNYKKCLEEISVDQVLEICRRILIKGNYENIIN